MRVAMKLVGVLVLALIMLRGVESYLTVRREMALFNTDMHRDARLLGRTLEPLVRDVWELKGPDRALKLIKDANIKDHPVQVQWVWFDSASLDERLDDAAMASLQRGNELFTEVEIADDQKALFHYVPIEVAGRTVGALALSESLTPREQYIRQTLVREAISAVVVLFISSGMVVILGLTFVGRPLQRLRDKIKRIGSGDLSGRVSDRGHDELADLARGLDWMCEQLAESRERTRIEAERRIAAVEQLRHVDRLTTIGRLASGIAHELGTPLNVVGGRATLIITGSLTPEEQITSARTIKSQAERMTAIIRNLLDFARRRLPNRATVDLVDVVRQSIELVSCLGYKGEVALMAPAQPVLVDVDSGQVQQVMTNVIENALQAMPHGGSARVTIETAQATPPAGIEAASSGYVCISVHDTGVGISPKHLPHIFDPFFTTKDVGQGTGLGLSIAYGIVREHGGWIDVQSRLGEGSVFAIFFPQREAS